MSLRDSVFMLIEKCPNIFNQKILWAWVIFHYGMAALVVLLYILSWVSDPASTRPELLEILRNM